jgi:chloramphenicol-sensitive protein RarD
MEHRKGVWYGIAAYVLWGLTPIFWKAFDDVPALELLAHRILWAVPLLALVVTIRHRWPAFVRIFSARPTRLLAAAAGTLLTINWGVYVWAVTSGHIVDASLGYFINPLVSVALGVIMLRERLRPAQQVAVGIAAVGVAGMALMVGTLPWVSLTLAFSFGIYGLLKKQPDAAPPLDGLFAEISVVAIPVIIFLALLAGSGEGSFGGDPATTMLLIAAGAVTVAPLFLFGASAQRLPLWMVGLLQYIAPTLQLLLGVWLYGEAITGGELFGFGLVWIALALFTFDSFRFTRSGRAEQGTV